MGAVKWHIHAVLALLGVLCTLLSTVGVMYDIFYAGSVVHTVTTNQTDVRKDVSETNTNKSTATVAWNT